MNQSVRLFSAAMVLFATTAVAPAFADHRPPPPRGEGHGHAAPAPQIGGSALGVLLAGGIAAYAYRHRRQRGQA